MGNKRKDPHKTNEFWIKRMKQVLKNKYISQEYRERCQLILEESKASFGAHCKQTSLHYPRERK